MSLSLITQFFSKFLGDVFVLIQFSQHTRVAFQQTKTATKVPLLLASVWDKKVSSRKPFLKNSTLKFCELLRFPTYLFFLSLWAKAKTRPEQLPQPPCSIFSHAQKLLTSKLNREMDSNFEEIQVIDTNCAHLHNPQNHLITEQTFCLYNTWFINFN